MQDAKPAGRDNRNNIDALAANVRKGSRVSIARAITLIESRKPEHRGQARQLLTLLNDAAGRSHRMLI